MRIRLEYGSTNQRLKLDDGVHRVGRSSGNDICISVPRVSKFHAELKVEGDDLWVRDVGSTNGTMLGPEQVTTEFMPVSDDSIVTFANVATLRMTTADDAGSSSGARLTNKNVSMIARYNPNEGYSSEAGERFLSLSVELFELLASRGQSQEINQAACRFVGKTIVAGRVVLLEDSGEATPIETIAQWTQQPRDEDAPLQLSSTIIDRVMNSRDALLVTDVEADGGLAGQKSIMDLNLRSAMAAPLFDNERVRGILYVDTQDPTKRFNSVDLQVLTATANAVAVKLRAMTLESELRTAARIQQSMLPETLSVPSGYEIDAYQVMCRSVGGDLYHCLQRPNGNTMIALGDVAGKGMPAALAMAASIVLISLLGKIGDDVLSVAQHMHDELMETLAPEQFLTLFVAEINPADGTMQYVNAGQDPPLIYHADGTSTPLESTGLPIAMVDGVPLADATTQLRPGDLMAIFSDGIPEATVAGEKFLGIEPVEQILSAKHAAPLPEIRDDIVHEVASFVGESGSSDDVTLVLLRRQ